MHLAFSFARHKYHVYQHDLFGVKKFHPITKKSFKLAMDKVKQQSDEVARGLINELERCFLEHRVMTTLGVVYP